MTDRDSSTGGELHYRIRWRASSPTPGAHASRHVGPGADFYGHVSLMQTSDPRRFDVLATQRDPQRSLRLRVYRQLGSVPVTVLMDVSASMPAAAGGSLDLLADFVDALAFAVVRTGDRFGFIAADTAVREELLLPHTRRRGAGVALAAALRKFAPSGTGASGLLEALSWVPRQAGLVFVVSDFHFPTDDLQQLLVALQRHQVVPVPVWSPRERELPRFGLIQLRDAEGGGERLLIMRPGLRSRVRAEVDRHRAEVGAVFTRLGCRPLSLGERFDPQTVTEYFHG